MGDGNVAHLIVVANHHTVNHKCPCMPRLNHFKRSTGKTDYVHKAHDGTCSEVDPEVPVELSVSDLIGCCPSDGNGEAASYRDSMSNGPAFPLNPLGMPNGNGKMSMTGHCGDV